MLREENRNIVYVGEKEGGDKEKEWEKRERDGEGGVREGDEEKEREGWR